MHIRAYQESDKAAVIQLWMDCGLIAPQNNPELDIQRKMDRDPSGFLVGEMDGSIMASCMVGYEGHRGWINYLGVHPSYQRKGYAEQMMRTAERMLMDMGCPKVNLQVRTTNLEVIKFYESIGYKQDAVVSFGRRLIEDH